MKVQYTDGDRMVLSGPPGGSGTVILLLVVGAVMTGGGAAFFEVGRANGLLGTAIPGAMVGLFGFCILVGGIGMGLTRERLVLDRVTSTGAWTQKLMGRNLKKPMEFSWSDVKHVRVEHYTEMVRGGDTDEMESEMVRARLLIDRPKRVVVLVDVEPQRLAFVRDMASTVAQFIGLEVEDTVTLSED